jgi:hypothetical protein
MHSAVGRVVEGPFEPLAGGGLRGVGGDRNQPSGKGGYPLRTHRVGLVRHGGRPYLPLSERLPQLFEPRQQPDVGGELGRRLADPGKSIEDEGVDLARVGLPGHRVAVRKAESFGNPSVEGAHLVVVTVEELEEGGLGAGCALDPSHLEAVPLETEPLEVEQEVLQPHTGSLADSGWLGGLEMGHAEGRFVGPLLGEDGEGRDNRQHPGDHEIEGIASDDEIRVIANVGRGRPEVKNRLGRRGAVGKGLEVGHYIVPGALFVLPYPLEIIGGHFEVGQHLLEGFGWDREPQLTLRGSERQPQAPPGCVTVTRREEPLHLLGCIAAGERVVEAVERGHESSESSIAGGEL